MRFREVKRDADSLGRVGVLSVNGFSIDTPVLWLGHNFKGPVRYWQQKGTRLPGLLVNAYEILRRPQRTQKMVDSGLQKNLGFRGPILMDSGGYLFQRSTDVSASAHKVANLYECCEADIGVALDHPLDPSTSATEHRRRWKLTLRNTEQMAGEVRGYGFMPVVHGYTLRQLKRACDDVKSAVGTPALVGVGSLVPLLKASYLGSGFAYVAPDRKKKNHVAFIADALRLVRGEFPTSCLHVFGVGGATTILAMFALGADSVDSVAWRLKAAYGAIQLPGVSDRFMSPRPSSPKNRRVIDEKETQQLARCRCPICVRYEHVGWSKRRLDSDFRSRAIHNAWVYLREVEAFRQKALDGGTGRFLRNRLSKSHRLHGLLAGAKR